MQKTGVFDIKYISKSKFDAEMARISRKNESIEYRRQLREERRKYWPKFKMPPTSKIALWAGFLLMLEIVFFCQYMAIKFHDTTPLIATVGAIGGWMTMFNSYNKKSTVENSKDGIIFETAMAQLQHSSESTSADAVG